MERYLPADAVTNRGLQGHTCKIFWAQKIVLDMLLRHMEQELKEWPQVVKNTIQEASKCHKALRECLDVEPFFAFSKEDLWRGHNVESRMARVCGEVLAVD